MTGVSNLNTSLLALRFYHISLGEPQMKTPVREALVVGGGVALQVPVFRIKTDRNDRGFAMFLRRWSRHIAEDT